MDTLMSDVISIEAVGREGFADYGRGAVTVFVMISEVLRPQQAAYMPQSVLSTLGVFPTLDDNLRRYNPEYEVVVFVNLVISGNLQHPTRADSFFQTAIITTSPTQSFNRLGEVFGELKIVRPPQSSSHFTAQSTGTILPSKQCVCGIVTSSMRQCGRCRMVKYCGTVCQRKDWPSHKTWCNLHRGVYREAKKQLKRHTLIHPNIELD
jgi:hypothetical protein